MSCLRTVLLKYYYERQHTRFSVDYDEHCMVACVCEYVYIIEKPIIVEANTVATVFQDSARVIH